MKNKIFRQLLLAFFVATGLSSCSDNYMEEMNTDDTKADFINPNAQLTTAQLQTYGDLNIACFYRNYIDAFTQHFMGTWGTTNYGGRHLEDNSQTSVAWERFYAYPLKNLTDGITNSSGPAAVNINAALRIYRVYIMSLVTDIYGDVPYFEAGRGFTDGIFTPKYDRQEDIYNDFFKELAEAVEQFDPAGDKISGDLIYGGDLNKWKKFANSLRLRFAMRISDVSPEKAAGEFQAALAADGGVFTSSADNALVKHIETAFSFSGEAYNDYRGNALSHHRYGADPTNNPTYVCSTLFNLLRDTGDPRTFIICRNYYDGLMTLTAPENRIDLTQEMLDNGIPFEPRDPGAYSWEPWPAGYTSPMLTAMAETNPAIDPILYREVEPKLATNFLMGDNPGVIITYPEVEFLLAEAALKGWTADGASVETHYRNGVRAAMDFLTSSYGCRTVSDGEFEAYMAANAIGYTSEKKKESINTQAWILHLTNGLEGWANIRRSGYPRLKSGAEYGFAQYMTGGNDIPVRLCYPTVESSYNKASYDEATGRVSGYSWHTPVWWDVDKQSEQ